LDPTTAQALAEAGVNMVGIDTLDVEAPGSSDYPVHGRLLAAGILILEGLDLAAAPAGPARLWAFPLRLDGAEAAPCRAVLETEILF
jgi:arylformamidase